MLKRRELAALLLGASLFGCVTGPFEVEQISPGQTVTQAVQTRRTLASYELGPAVAAKSCETAIFRLLPVTKPATEQDPVRAAVASAPGKWSTLVKAELTFTQYPYVIARTLCWEAAGRVARPRLNRSASR